MGSGRGNDRKSLDDEHNILCASAAMVPPSSDRGLHLGQCSLDGGALCACGYGGFCVLRRRTADCAKPVTVFGDREFEILSISGVVCLGLSRERSVLLSSAVLAEPGHRRKTLGAEPSGISRHKCAAALVERTVSLSAFAAAGYFLVIFGTDSAAVDKSSR